MATDTCITSYFSKNREIREEYFHGALKELDGGGIGKWIRGHSSGNTIPLPL